MRQQAVVLLLGGALYTACGGRSGFGEWYSAAEDASGAGGRRGDAGMHAGGAVSTISANGGRGGRMGSTGAAGRATTGGRPTAFGSGGRDAQGGAAPAGGTSGAGAATDFGGAPELDAGAAGVSFGGAAAGSAGANGMPSPFPLGPCSDAISLDGPRQTTLQAGSYAASVAADWNNDGRLDLAITDHENRTVTVLFGFGQGALVEKSGSLFSSAPNGLTTADVDDDGIADLVVTSGTYGRSIYVLFGNGDGTFYDGSEYYLGDATGAALAGDWNADGTPDLGVASSKHFSILLGLGAGQFGPTLLTASGAVVDQAVVADLNGDGMDDLVAQGEAVVDVFLSKGDGAFADPLQYEVAGQRGLLAARDFDGDGTIDVLVESECTKGGENGVFLLHGNGDGTLAAAVLVDPACSDVPATLLDVNGDQRWDLLQPAGATLLGLGDGTFSDPVSTLVSGSVLGAGDWNGDGDSDIVEATKHAVHVRLGNGDGTFGTTRMYEPSAAGARINEIVLEDLNADGDADLGVITTDTLTGASDFRVMPGAGNAIFSASSVYPVEARAMTLTSADLNADHRPDVVITHPDSSLVSVLLAGPDGGFGENVVYTTEQGPSSAAVGDVDGDGVLDVLTANEGSSTLSVLRGTGDGTLATHVDQSLAIAPTAIALGDLDADGVLDVVLTSSAVPTISVLLGDGAGSFDARTSYALSSPTAAPALADFNEDGHLDLITTEGTTAYVWLGIGDGTFANGGGYTDAQPNRLAAADMNGDGHVDLVTAGSGLTILFGIGNGGFACTASYATGTLIPSFAIGDVSGDHEPDAVAVDWSVTKGGDTTDVFINSNP